MAPPAALARRLAHALAFPFFHVPFFHVPVLGNPSVGAPPPLDNVPPPLLGGDHFEKDHRDENTTTTAHLEELDLARIYEDGEESSGELDEPDEDDSTAIDDDWAAQHDPNAVQLETDGDQPGPPLDSDDDESWTDLQETDLQEGAEDHDHDDDEEGHEEEHGEEGGGADEESGHDPYGEEDYEQHADDKLAMGEEIGGSHDEEEDSAEGDEGRFPDLGEGEEGEDDSLTEEDHMGMY